MTPTGVRPAQETRPRPLVFQLLGTAHSVTARLAEALGELGLSPAGLDLLTRLAQARESLWVDDDVRELVVMLERDGLVRTVTNNATRPRVTPPRTGSSPGRWTTWTAPPSSAPFRRCDNHA